MAKVRVYRDEAGGELFPPRCMRCGADADVTRTQTFSWMPGWVHVLIFVGLLPWLIVCLVMRKTMRVAVPLCGRHANHFLTRQLYIWLGMGFWVVYAIALAVLAKQLGEDLTIALFAGLVFGGLLWLIVGLVLMNGAIRAGHMTKSWVELVNVDRDFADEWQEMEPEPEPRPRRKRVAKRDDEDDKDW